MPIEMAGAVASAQSATATSATSEQTVIGTPRRSVLGERFRTKISMQPTIAHDSGNCKNREAECQEDRQSQSPLSNSKQPLLDLSRSDDER